MLKKLMQPATHTLKTSFKRNLSVGGFKRVKFSKAQLLIFILIFGCIGAYALFQGSAAGPNVWLSTTGNDSTCVRSDQTKPCASLNKALSLAQAADIIQMAGGTYGTAFGCGTSDPNGQPGSNHLMSITGHNFASNVTVTVAPGATAIIPCAVGLGDASSHTGANYVGFDATGGTIRVDGFRADSDHNFLSNIDVYCEDAAPYILYTVNNIPPEVVHPAPGGSHQWCSAFLRGTGTNFTMTGGSIGPTTAATGTLDSTLESPSHWTFNGVNSHDARWANDCNGGAQACHTENFMLHSASFMTWKNSIFNYCGNSTCVYVGENGGPTSSNIEFDNVICLTNSVDMEKGASVSMNYSVGCTPSLGNLGPGMTGANLTLNNSIIYGNVCPQSVNPGLWDAYIHYAHNLWVFDDSTGGSTSACGDSTGVAYNPFHNPYDDIFVNFAAGDYHQKAGSPAIDIGDINNYNLASPDYYGQTRYAGTAPDAGPTEYVPLANVWVATTGNNSTCVRGDQTKPCLTFAKACSIAQAGDIVSVSAGNYAAQTINSTDCPSASSSAQIKFVGQSVGAVPSTGAAADAPNINGACNSSCANALLLGSGGSNGPSYVTFQNLRITTEINVNGNQTASSAPGTTAVGVVLDHISGGAFFIAGVTNASITNSDFGNCWFSQAHPCTSENSNDWGQGTGNNRQASSYTIDHVVFHDYVKNTSNHGECFFPLDWRGTTTIKNSWFYNCVISGGIRLERIVNPPAGSLMTIQNNWFGSMWDTDVGTGSRCEDITWGSNSGSLSNVLIHYNTFSDGGGPFGSSGSPTSSFRIIGNLVGFNPNGSCEITPANGNYGSAFVDYNVWVGGDTGTHSAHVANSSAFNTLLTNSTGGSLADYHLANNTNLAIGFVPNSGADYNLATDKDGLTRTFPTTAGSQLFTSGSSGTTPGDLNSDSHVNVFDLSILLSHYGTSAPASQGDINNDGVVNIFDLSILLSHYGT